MRIFLLTIFILYLTYVLIANFVAEFKYWKNPARTPEPRVYGGNKANKQLNTKRHRILIAYPMFLIFWLLLLFVLIHDLGLL
jgi:hypothetical protein